MVGCSIAIAMGVVGAVMVAKRLFFRARCGGRFRGGWHRNRWGGGGGGGRRGFGRSFWLRALFEELDTTPGQEREIRSALEEFRETARSAKSGLFDARADVARAMTASEFDEGAVLEASQRADAVGAKVKEAMTAALRRVHGVLDPKQRERLGEILAKGPFGRGGGPFGPYRSPA